MEAVECRRNDFLDFEEKTLAESQRSKLCARWSETTVNILTVEDQFVSTFFGPFID